MPMTHDEEFHEEGKERGGQDSTGSDLYRFDSVKKNPLERPFEEPFVSKPVTIFGSLKYFARVLVSSADRFYWDDGFSKAASLAYTTLLSLVPFMAVSFGFLASFKLSEDVPGLQNFIFRQFVPTSGVDQVLEYINEFSQAVTSLNMVAIPFLVVTAVLLLNSIEYALNRVWQVYEARTIAHRLSIFCAIIVIAPILAVSAYYTTKFRVEPLIDDFGDKLWILAPIYNFMLPWFIDLCAFISLYYLVPKAPVLFRSAATGGMVAAFLFDLAKSAFAWYIRTYSSYEKIYGALAAVPIFLFWLYLAWLIVLFGAEVSYQSQYLPREGKLWKRALLSVGEGRFILALQSLLIIGTAFKRGQPLPNDLELSERLGCSTVVLKPALDALRRAHIITTGDSRDMPISLKRSPETISIRHIRDAIYNDRLKPHFSREIARTFEAFRKGEDGSTLTLSELLREES